MSKMLVCNHVISQTRKPDLENPDGDMICPPCWQEIADRLENTNDTDLEIFLDSHIEIICKECWGC
jgi:hypothetical protein